MNQAPSFLLLLASFCAIFCAIIVPFSRNPISSAIALLGTLFSTAGIYFTIGNSFLGAVQILVYAGAIAVLFAFIIMLLDLRPSLLKKIPGRNVFTYTCVFVSVVYAIVLLAGFSNTKIPDSGVNIIMSARDVSLFFLSQYPVAFQVAGLLIFGAILGAIVLAKGHLGKESK